MTPKERAERAAQAMWNKDSASPALGLKMENVDEGHAQLSLVVEKRHTNGHGICHGGVIFMLADTAFAFACNSRNQSTVAHHNAITYVAPARPGDQLMATATEVSLRGRNGIYDVTVVNQDNDLIAEFRGCSRAVRGHLFDEEGRGS